MRILVFVSWILAAVPFVVSQAYGRLEGVTHVIAFPELNFRRPLWVGHPGDGTDRLFVVEQQGVVHVFPNDPGIEETRVALDLRHRVRRRHNEEGLLGLAFHPRVAENGAVFLHYSTSDPRRNVLSRMQLDADRTVLLVETEEVLLEVEQPWGNHNGGDIRFGLDGHLYVSLGDGGAGGDPQNNGQDLSTLLGAILRLDVDRQGEDAAYAIPPDNPFLREPGARPEIWAWGLRNVWRMSFDRETGTLWAGDVGQDRWEEIDIIERGGNYGWNLFEGRHRYRNGRASVRLIEPVVEHGHREAKSITGGFVYRGRAVPALHGAYVYADYVTGTIWALWTEGGEVTRHVEIGAARSITSFGEDRDGELYFCSFDGRIHRFVERED